MTTEIIISPVLDENIQEHLAESEIWNCAYVENEIDDIVKKSFPMLYKYTIKFDGLTPIQFLKRETL